MYKISAWKNCTCFPELCSHENGINPFTDMLNPDAQEQPYFHSAEWVLSWLILQFMSVIIILPVYVWQILARYELVSPSLTKAKVKHHDAAL